MKKKILLVRNEETFLVNAIKNIMINVFLCILASSTKIFARKSLN